MRESWRRFCRTLCCLLSFGFSACMPWAAVTTEMSGPLGSTSRGVLLDGREMPHRGVGYEFYHRRDRRYGSVPLTRLVEDVAARVADVYPGSELKVGDESGRGGGRILGHSSHRNGLDVDFAFFVRSPKKTQTRAYVLAPLDQYGVVTTDRDVAYFDYEKNWQLIEALLTSDEAQVQWIFVSSGLKVRLLSYALAAGKDMDVIYRAAHVLHQPKDSAIHNDHFHVRIYCPPQNESVACVQRRPIWPWIDKSFLNEDPGPDDHTLITLALEGL